jgi:cyclopropane-fatty-acyl-phospholipid synthase
MVTQGNQVHWRAAETSASEIQVPWLESARARKGRMLLLDLLDQHMKGAQIRFLLRGAPVTVGRDAGTPRFSVRVHDPDFFLQTVAFGSLGLGESFMGRGFEMEEGRLEDLLTALLRSRLDHVIVGDLRLATQVAFLKVAAHIRGKARNVRAHYDLGDDLFESFLDSTLTYSCGYSCRTGESLEEQQRGKLDRICRKLRLAEGARMLDIGCGFGGLLVFAAKHYGATGLGVTNSKRHAQRAREKVAQAGLASKVTIELDDYNRLSGSFDRVVSVGMMEHLPRREYLRYLRAIQRLLAQEGLALVHTIGCNGAKNEHDPFIQKYIFPGSGQPRLSEIAGCAEKTGLAIADVENLVRHYECTLREWLKRFEANRDQLDPAKYDERFKRMWQFYLAGGVAAAAASDSALYQVLLMKDARDPMPLVRV